MKKLLKYKDGSIYQSGGNLGIVPSEVEPLEEYDVSHLTEKEIDKIKKDPDLTKKLKAFKI